MSAVKTWHGKLAVAVRVATANLNSLVLLKCGPCGCRRRGMSSVWLSAPWLLSPWHVVCLGQHRGYCRRGMSSVWLSARGYCRRGMSSVWLSAPWLSSPWHVVCLAVSPVAIVAVACRLSGCQPVAIVAVACHLSGCQPRGVGSVAVGSVNVVPWNNTDERCRCFVIYASILLLLCHQRNVNNCMLYSCCHTSQFTL